MSENIKLYQGTTELTEKQKDDSKALEFIKQKLSDLFNMKNIHFLFGAGTSAGAIPTMKELISRIEAQLKTTQKEKFKNLKEKFKNLKEKNNENLEEILGVLYSKRAYNKGIQEEDSETEELIEIIEKTIFEEINIDFSLDKTLKILEIYKTFYQIITYRNKDLARVNIFTTNNDLFNEKALDNLNINYNNGFGGGLERFFNPSRFDFTFSKKIENGIEKYEPLDNMVYLYKLHGSINWIEAEGNSFFNIKEIIIPNKDEDNILIYPNPLKQGKSLTTPYTDIFREFQKKLLLDHSVLFVVGYGFNDEHINNIIYQALSSNSSLSVVVFSNCDVEDLKDCKKAIFNIDDKRIYKIFGKDKDKIIHYFNYIVKNLIQDLNENQDENILEKFTEALSKVDKEVKNENR